jgi:HKD family nuclease
MDVELATQRPKGPKAEQLKERLAGCATACGCDELNAAAAYVTIEGVNALLEALGNCPLANSRWLVGLDDAISQPGAISRIRSLPNATVRVVAYGATGARFHTKMVHLKNGKVATSAVLMVGSANLSRAALERNAEAAAFISSKTVGEATLLADTFESVWKLGHVPSQEELDAYAVRYNAARTLRKKLEKILLEAPPSTNVVTSPDEAQLDPSLARTCWIECGRITLMGRELELKGIQARFFGLKPTGGSTEVLALVGVDGSTHPTTFNFRGNSMWRVYFPSTIPEVKAGLRPIEADGSQGRSPYVAVFQRTSTSGRFKLKFLHEQAAAYAALKARSARLGTLGDTGSRLFGWC